MGRICLAAALAAAVAGCSKTVDAGDIPAGADTGALSVTLASLSAAGDLDPRVDEVWVRIDSVTVHHEDRGWVDLSTERQDLDLLGALTAVGDGDVWVGAYDQARIGITDAWIVVDGVEEDLAFTGDVDPLDPMAEGLGIDESFFVDADSVTTLAISFDLAENLDDDGGEWSLGAATGAEVDIDEDVAG